MARPASLFPVLLFAKKGGFYKKIAEGNLCAARPRLISRGPCRLASLPAALGFASAAESAVSQKLVFCEKKPRICRSSRPRDRPFLGALRGCGRAGVRSRSFRCLRWPAAVLRPACASGLRPPAVSRRCRRFPRARRHPARAWLVGLSCLPSSPAEASTHPPPGPWPGGGLRFFTFSNGCGPAFLRFCGEGGKLLAVNG